MPLGRRLCRGARCRHEQGYSLVAFLLLLPIVLHLAAVTAVLGQAVSRKVALQIVADAGAFTGATVQATGLNQLALWNGLMQWAWLAFTFPPVPVQGGLTGSPLYPAFKAQQLGEALPILPSSVLTFVPMVECNVADAWVQLYRQTRRTLGATYDLENVGFALRAREEARSVSILNGHALFPGEQLRFAEYAHTPREFAETGIPPFAARNPGVLAHTPQVPNGSPLTAGVLAELPASVRSAYLVPATRRLRYACVTIRSIRAPTGRGINLYFYRYEQAMFDVWRTKMPRPVPGLGAQPVDAFVWVVRAPAVRVPIFSDLLGDALIPEMTAAASAKPVGGSIVNGDRGYVTKLVPLGSVMFGHYVTRPEWRLLPSVFSKAGVIHDEATNQLRFVLH